MRFLKIFGGAYGAAENFGLPIGKNRYAGQAGFAGLRGYVGRLGRPTSRGIVSGTRMVR